MWSDERRYRPVFWCLIAPGVVSRPSCAANQPVVLTHFQASSVTLRVLETLIHFLWIPFSPPRPLCHHYRLTCSIVLEAGKLHLNISLWHNNTLNMPLDMIYTGRGWCSNIFLTWSQRPDTEIINFKNDRCLCQESYSDCLHNYRKTPRLCPIYHTAIIAKHCDTNGLLFILASISHKQ